MAELIWTEQAIKDIDNIATFISKSSFKYVQIQVEKIFQTTLILEKKTINWQVSS